jgi:hypothetical protein
MPALNGEPGVFVLKARGAQRSAWPARRCAQSGRHGTLHAVEFRLGRRVDAIVMQRPPWLGDTAPPADVVTSSRSR